MNTKYEISLVLSREEYQILCRALIKVESEVRGADEKEVLFWSGNSAGVLAEIRTRIRRAFTVAFGQNRSLS